jgi:hypothetical protein
MIDGNDDDDVDVDVDGGNDDSNDGPAAVWVNRLPACITLC